MVHYWLFHLPVQRVPPRPIRRSILNSLGNVLVVSGDCRVDGKQQRTTRATRDRRRTSLHRVELGWGVRDVAVWDALARAGVPHRHYRLHSVFGGLRGARGRQLGVPFPKEPEEGAEAEGADDARAGRGRGRREGAGG